MTRRRESGDPAGSLRPGVPVPDSIPQSISNPVVPSSLCPFCLHLSRRVDKPTSEGQRGNALGLAAASLSLSLSLSLSFSHSRSLCLALSLSDSRESRSRESLSAARSRSDPEKGKVLFLPA